MALDREWAQARQNEVNELHRTSTEAPKEKPAMNTMAENHERDYRIKDLYDEARRALRAVMDDKDARGRLSPKAGWQAHDLIDELEQRSAHVVAVWD